MIAALAKSVLALAIAARAYVHAVPLHIMSPDSGIDGDVAPTVVSDPCIAHDADDCDNALDETPRAIAPTSDDDIGCGTCDDNGDGSCTCPPADDPWANTRADDADDVNPDPCGEW